MDSNNQNGGKTELEYWAQIESLGGFAWSLNHNLADGRIDDPTGNIGKDIERMQSELKKLVQELEERFGVIPPDKCPRPISGNKLLPLPKGKKYYWAWYKRMQFLWNSMDYSCHICSACPLSLGLKYQIRLNQIPCGAISGSMYRLSNPWTCGMVSFCHWTEERLKEEITKKGGETAWLNFKFKEAGLKALLEAKDGHWVIKDHFFHPSN